MGDSECNCSGSESSLRFRGTASEADRANGGDIGGGGGVSTVDDTSALRLRRELPNPEVFAGAEQDHGDGVDLRGGAGDPHAIQLATHAAPTVGTRRRSRGSQLVLVVHRGGSARLCVEWVMWSGLDWVLI